MKKLLLFIGLGFILFLGTSNSYFNPNGNYSTIDSITYYNHVEPIIRNNCVTCHSEPLPSSGFSLTTYEEVRFKAENGPLLTRINDAENPMPERGLINKEDRLIIEKWAKLGYPMGIKTTEELAPASNNKIAFLESSITPINLDKEGFEFFDLMPAHWVGDLTIMGQHYEWFSFDYRPISPSHVHGIFEGGSMGNLFTSFFIANFNGTKTIIARNGGVLNGTYRTSYFILDKVSNSKKRKSFRFVDAYGGKEIMYMELEFTDNELYFNSYTSQLGVNGKPKLHMEFKGTRMHQELSKKIADSLDYPKNIPYFDLTLPTPSWASEYKGVSSASYITKQQNDETLNELANIARDPIPIDSIPYLSKLKVNIKKGNDYKTIIYLSIAPLTDKKGDLILEYGYVKKSLFDGVLSFPEIIAHQKEFTFTYLHPGAYYVTLVSDINNDGFASEGDIISKSTLVKIPPERKIDITIKL